MILRTKLDWQGYRLALQNEETMGCSTEQTDLCNAIDAYREKVYEMQEILRKTAGALHKLYPHVQTGMVEEALELLTDFQPDIRAEYEHVSTDGDVQPICETEARNLLRYMHGDEKLLYGIRFRGVCVNVENGMLRRFSPSPSGL